MKELNKKIVRYDKMRKEAISNYTFYIKTLSGKELEDESKRILNKAMDANIILHVPDYDDNADGDIMMFK